MNGRGDGCSGRDGIGHGRGHGHSASRRAFALSAGAALVVAAGLSALLPIVAGSRAPMHTRRAAAAAAPGRLDPELAVRRLEELDPGGPDAPAAAMRVVHAAMLHHWPDEGRRDAETECRLVDDPIVWCRLRVLDAFGADAAELARRERGDWRAALRLGVGLCSQQSVVLAEALRERGIDAGATGLGGHVVVVVRSGGGERVLDPDFGVELPMALAVAERSPESVRDAYLGAGVDGATARRIAEIYGAAGNGVYPAPLLGAWTVRGALSLMLALVAGLGLLAYGAWRGAPSGAPRVSAPRAASTPRIPGS